MQRYHPLIIVLKNTKQTHSNPTDGNKSRNLATFAAFYDG